MLTKNRLHILKPQTLFSCAARNTLAFLNQVRCNKDFFHGEGNSPWKILEKHYATLTWMRQGIKKISLIKYWQSKLRKLFLPLLVKKNIYIHTHICIKYVYKHFNKHQIILVYFLVFMIPLMCAQTSAGEKQT